MAVSERPAPPAAEAPAEDETAKAPNWLKGEEIMATFALAYAEEKNSTTEINERARNAGRFYREMLPSLPRWGLWWPSSSGKIKTVEDSIRLRSDEAIYQRGAANKGLLDKMTRLFAKQWKHPKNVPDCDAMFDYKESGTTDVEWWETCETKARDKWQELVVEKRANGEDTWKNYRKSTFPWVFRFACPDSPYLKDVERFKERITRDLSDGDRQKITPPTHAEAHKFFSERATRASLFGQWIIDPNQRTQQASKGVSVRRQKALNNLIASTGQDHRTPGVGRVVMGGDAPDSEQRKLEDIGERLLDKKETEQRDNRLIANALLQASGFPPIDFEAHDAAAAAKKAAAILESAIEEAAANNTAAIEEARRQTTTGDVESQDDASPVANLSDVLGEVVVEAEDERGAEAEDPDLLLEGEIRDEPFDALNTGSAVPSTRTEEPAAPKPTGAERRSSTRARKAPRRG